MITSVSNLILQLLFHRDVSKGHSSLCLKNTSFFPYSSEGIVPKSGIS